MLLLPPPGSAAPACHAECWSARGNQRDEDVTTAITGGTGAYEGARGSLAQRNVPNGRMENTIHLLP